MASVVNSTNFNVMGNPTQKSRIDKRCSMSDGSITQMSCETHNAYLNSIVGVRTHDSLETGMGVFTWASKLQCQYNVTGDGVTWSAILQ